MMKMNLQEGTNDSWQRNESVAGGPNLKKKKCFVHVCFADKNEI